MQSVQQQGYQTVYFTLAELSYENGKVNAHCHFVEVDLDKTDFLKETRQAKLCLFDCHAVIIRKDPPFDENYLYATYLLDLVAARGVNVSNSSQGIRDCNEKIFATHFADLMPPTLISKDLNEIAHFLALHQKIVLKPLNAMAGQEIILADANSLGVKGLLALMTHNEQRMILAQKFIPEVKQGDKRIILIKGEPLPYVLLRVPATDDFRANLAIGGSGKIIPLTIEDQQLCERLKPQLQARGLDFVGIDLIHGLLTEINVTSATGIKPIMRETGMDIGKLWVEQVIH